MIPRDRFFWWYSGASLLLGPFGFVVGPLIAQRGSRKAALGHPVKARVTQATDKGLAWWQRRVMTPLTPLSAFGVFAILSGLPTFLFLVYAELTM